MARDKVVVTGSSGMWWLMAVAGVLTVLFGLATLFWPGLTLVVFVYLFSAYVLAWGVVSLVSGFMQLGRQEAFWWLALIVGVLLLGVGVYLVRHPAASFATVILLVGFTFIFHGVADIVKGLFTSDASSKRRTFSVLGGALGVVAGAFILTQPVSGGVAFVWIIGLYALLLGPVLIASSMYDQSEIEANTRR